MQILPFLQRHKTGNVILHAKWNPNEYPTSYFIHKNILGFIQQINRNACFYLMDATSTNIEVGGK
jgi:hypothetical protein